MRVKLGRPDSRRRPRTRVRWPVTVEVGNRVLHGETLDVSQSGVKVRLAERLPDATLARLHIAPPEGCPIDAQAVVWRMDAEGPVFLFLKKAPAVLLGGADEAAPAPRVVTILVVDDDQNVGAFAVDALGSAGYLVLSTHDPVEALRMVKDRDIDLLLVDVIMPLMDGRELARRIVTLRPTTKVLLMSGFEVSGLRETGWPFVGKPFGVTELIERVEECTTSKRRPSVFGAPRRNAR